MYVAEETGIYKEPVKPNYSRMPDGVTLLRELSKHLKRISKRKAQPGDIAVFAPDRGLANHVALINAVLEDTWEVIHCDGTALELEVNNVRANHGVELHVMQPEEMRTLVAVFTYPEIDDG